MGSLVFQMEHGVKPELSVDNQGKLGIPQINTNHQSVDTIIRKAWLGECNHTSDMLEVLKFLDTHGASPSSDTERSSESTKLHRDQIKRWRECRENNFGKNYLLYNVFILVC